MVTYRLLDRFQQLFAGVRYRHRASTNGDKVARCLYEDLFTLGESTALCTGLADHRVVVNTQNHRRAIKARRGDGTLGQLAPGAEAIVEPGFSVAKGQVTDVEIGVDVKMVSKAMIKQISRVDNDLRDQVKQFQTRASNPVCVGVVGLNYAAHYVSYEGDRVYRTDGTAGKPHPKTEAPKTEPRLHQALDPKFDELLVLKYRATNEPPYPFEWVDLMETRLDYGAALARISREYDTRFGG